MIATHCSPSSCLELPPAVGTRPSSAVGQGFLPGRQGSCQCGRTLEHISSSLWPKQHECPEVHLERWEKFDTYHSTNIGSLDSWKEFRRADTTFSGYLYSLVMNPEQIRTYQNLSEATSKLLSHSSENTPTRSSTRPYKGDKQHKKYVTRRFSSGHVEKPHRYRIQSLVPRKSEQRPTLLPIFGNRVTLRTLFCRKHL